MFSCWNGCFLTATWWTFLVEVNRGVSGPEGRVLRSSCVGWSFHLTFLARDLDPVRVHSRGSSARGWKSLSPAPACLWPRSLPGAAAALLLLRPSARELRGAPASGPLCSGCPAGQSARSWPSLPPVLPLPLALAPRRRAPCPPCLAFVFFSVFFFLIINLFFIAFVF